jgi:hypothetical protein
MIHLLEGKRHAIRHLCGRYRVRRLEVFGSAADGRFNPQRSDVDLLVEFEELPEGTHADDYFGLLFAREELFNRPVHLVMTSAVRNPYFLQEVGSSGTVLYAAA